MNVLAHHLLRGCLALLAPFVRDASFRRFLVMHALLLACLSLAGVSRVAALAWWLLQVGCVLSSHPERASGGPRPPRIARTLLHPVLPSLGLLYLGWPTAMFMVSGPSMEPTLRAGELVIGRAAHGAVDQGDVVVAQGPDGINLIKRVAALGGHHLSFPFGGVVVDGKEIAPRDTVSFPSVRPATTVVADGQVFLLGDNARYSLDSRDLGPLPLKAVTHVIGYIVWSRDLHRIGTEMPKAAAGQRGQR